MKCLDRDLKFVGLEQIFEENFCITEKISTHFFMQDWAKFVIRFSFEISYKQIKGRWNR